MKLRFSPVYVDENNVLTDEGRKMREQYLSKKDMTASFFSMAQPILCVGIEKETCPPPLLPLIKELKDKGIVVEVKDDSAKKQKADNKKAFDDALVQAKVDQIEEGLKNDHVLTPGNKPAILKGELDSALDLTRLKNSREILSVLHCISSEIGARVAFIKKVGDGFKADECNAAVSNVVKIRLSTLTHEAVQVYSSFSETDERIRSDKSAREPDFLCEAITICRSKRAKLYMISNFKRSPEPYILAVTTLPDAGDGLVLMEARESIKKLDSLLG